MPATLARSAGNIVRMNCQDPREQDIIRSWYSNAAPWTRAIREASIASRKLITDQAIIDAVLSVSRARILDIGCGEGWLARALSGLGLTVHGRRHCSGTDRAGRSIERRGFRRDIVGRSGVGQHGVPRARLCIDCEAAVALRSLRCRRVQFLLAGQGVGGLADRGAAKLSRRSGIFNHPNVASGCRLRRSALSRWLARRELAGFQQRFQQSCTLVFSHARDLDRAIAALRFRHSRMP